MVVLAVISVVPVMKLTVLYDHVPVCGCRDAACAVYFKTGGVLGCRACPKDISCRCRLCLLHVSVYDSHSHYMRHHQCELFLPPSKQTEKSEPIVLNKGEPMELSYGWVKNIIYYMIFLLW